MKTTREIIDACDAADVKVHAMRSPPEAYERLLDTTYRGSWSVMMAAERDGVKVETTFFRGDTFDAALAKAWAKFEPASAAGLPPVPALAAPVFTEDADFKEVDENERIPF